MQQTSQSADPAGISPVSASPFPHETESQIDFREVAGVLWAGKWVVLLIALVIALIGGLYIFLLPPVYEADGSVQVDDTQEGRGGNSDVLSSVISGGTVEADAEIQILQSRMILGKVAKAMNLTVEVLPRYCLKIGAAMARHHGGGELARPFLGIDECAWGGEQIEVSTFEVPDSMIGISFTLAANADGYSIFNPDGSKLLDGQVGVPAMADTAAGQVHIFVKTLIAHPKTQFYIAQVPVSRAIGGLQGALAVSELGKQSGVIQLVATGESAKFVTDFINSIETEYLRQNVERRSAEAQQSLEFLKAQLPDAKAKVTAAQFQLNSYQQQHGSVDVTTETQEVLSQQVVMETRRLELEQQRQLALARFTASHPSILALDDQEKLIEAQEAKLKGQTQKLPETQQRIFSLRSDLEISQQLYTEMLETIQTLEIARAGTVGNVRIIDRPLFPRGASKPKRVVLMAGVIFVAFFLGAAWVVVRHMVHPGVDDPSLLERELNLVSYASIPFATEQRKLAQSAARVGGPEPILGAAVPHSSAIEAIRSLRTSLHFAMLEATNNLVMLTGPSPGLGKSFISINLGAVLASADKRILIVDADLRRGQLHKFLRGMAKPGLSEYIAGDSELGDVIRQTSVPGLSILPRGATPPNPAELLLNGRFAVLMRTISADFDYVLIDTPPALAVTDAAIIGRFVGNAFIVLKEGAHSIHEIGEVLVRLKRNGVNVTGAIFNQTNQRAGYYGYGRYRYQYEAYRSS